MTNNYEKIICDSLLEIKNLIEECKSIILNAANEDKLADEHVSDEILDELTEASFIYEELVKQMLQ